GTVAGVSTSQGGKAAGASTAWGNTAVGKTSGGNMYAGHDGNVYKNTGNGWEKYDNGSWNSVNKPQPNWQGAQSSEQRMGSESNQQRSSGASSYNRSSGGYERSSSQMQDLNREAQNRWRGGQNSQRFQDFQRGGGDRFGGGGGERFGSGGFRGRRGEIKFEFAIFFFFKKKNKKKKKGRENKKKIKKKKKNNNAGG